MRRFFNLMKSRFSEEDIISTVERCMYLTVVCEPVKSLSSQFDDVNLVEVAINSITSELRSIGKRPKKHIQKQYLLSAILLTFESSLLSHYIFREAADRGVIIFSMWLAENDATLDKVIQDNSDNENPDKICAHIRAFYLRRYVFNILIEASLVMAYNELFNEEPSEALMKNFRQLVKWHIKKLNLEILLREKADDYILGAIKSNYDFSLANRRRNIIDQYRLAIELSNFERLPMLWDEFIEIIE